MKMPRISIITFSYNSAATLAITLRSLKPQNHGDCEHIVIDGASKDETLAVVQHERQHLARVVSEPDKGIYDAMNKVLLGLALYREHAVERVNI